MKRPVRSALAVALLVLLAGGVTLLLAERPTCHAALEERLLRSSSWLDVLGKDVTLQTGAAAQEVMGTGFSIQVDRVATVPLAHLILYRHSIDLDHDNGREFVVQSESNPSWVEFYESTGADAFNLAHVLDLSPGPGFARDAGDADNDGLGDVVVNGITEGVRYLRIYESASPNTYPTELAWELTGWPITRGGRIADTDGDGRREIVIAGLLTYA